MRAVRVAGISGVLVVLLRTTRDIDPTDQWLTKAALLEVWSCNPADVAAVASVHERVAAALARGEVRGFGPGVSGPQHRAVDGDGASILHLSRDPQHAVDERRQVVDVAVAGVVVVWLLVLTVPGLLVCNGSRRERGHPRVSRHAVTATGD